jgi:hypothetical protein
MIFALKDIALILQFMSVQLAPIMIAIAALVMLLVLNVAVQSIIES